MKFCFLMMMSGWLPPCHEGVADCRPDRALNGHSWSVSRKTGQGNSAWPETLCRTEEARAEERVVLSWFVCVCVVSPESWNSKLQR